MVFRWRNCKEFQAKKQVLKFDKKVLKFDKKVLKFYKKGDKIRVKSLIKFENGC